MGSYGGRQEGIGWPIAVRGVGLGAVLLIAVSAVAAEYFTVVGQYGGACRSVAARGDTVFLGQGPNLWVIDASVTSAPQIVQHVLLSDLIRNLYVDGDQLYVANDSAGLLLYDIADPANPRPVGGYDTDRAAYAAAVQGATVYVADGEGGLKLIDFTNPSAPHLVREVKTGYGAYDVVTSGALALVAMDVSGLAVVDVSTSTTARIIGQVNTTGTVLSVDWLDGQTAVVADGTPGLQIVNLTDPLNPLIIQTVNTPGDAVDVAIGGDLAYVADGATGLLVYDLADTLHPLQVSSFNTPVSARSIAVEAPNVFIADMGWGSGLQIVNVAEPTQPAPAGQMVFGGVIQYVTADSPLVYVTEMGTGLHILDMTHLTTTVRLGDFDTPGSARNIALAGSLALIPDGFDGGVNLIDCADPRNPQFKANFPVSDNSRLVTVRDHLGYLAASTYFRIFDFTNPTQPLAVGKAATPGIVREIALQGDLAYVADYAAGMQVFDVDDPTSPTLIGAIDTTGYVRRLAVSGSYAYLAAYEKGIQIVDISNPRQPELKTTYTPPTHSQDVKVVGEFMFVADEKLGVQCVSIANPLAPTLLASFQSPDWISDLSIRNNLIYAADNSGGLFVLRFSGLLPSAVGQWEVYR